MLLQRKSLLAGSEIGIALATLSLFKFSDLLGRPEALLELSRSMSSSEVQTCLVNYMGPSEIQSKNSSLGRKSSPKKKKSDRLVRQQGLQMKEVAIQSHHK